MRESQAYHWRADVRKRLSAFNLDPQDEVDLVEEVAQHLEDQFGELLLSIGADAARQQLLAQLRDEQFNEATEHR
ncbi:MAG: hypothetical protein ABI120_11005, partial [Gemmatimonadaceae bacterium]